MTSFFRHHAIPLLLLVIRVISISDSIKKLPIFSSTVNSISQNIIRKTSGDRITALDSLDYDWDVKWYRSMPIDHFNYRDVETFSLK